MSKARDLADSAQEINILDGKSFLDEDNLASDSATGIASQQSIKAYVDGITTTNITSTGALNSGSITSGFGNIDNGSSTITTTGAITGGSFVIGSADINENDLESIDGITAGTVSASKAVVVNTDKDVTGFRNITATGTISGTLSGSLSSTTTATTQAESDDSTKIATTAYVVDKITTLIGGAPSTLNDLNELAAAINDDANYNSTLTTALATKLPLAGGTITGNITFGDNNKAIFGAGSDLQIYHDGSGSYVKEGGTGSLYLQGTDVRIQNASGENILNGTSNGAVTIYYDNAAKLSTTSTGIDVTGTAVTDGVTSSGNIEIAKDSPQILWNDTTGGTQVDYSAYANGGAFAITDVPNSYNLLTLNSGSVSLAYQSTVKLATTSTGIQVTGNIANASGNLTLDVAGDITLDSDGGYIWFNDGGNTIGYLKNESTDLSINVHNQNRDIFFKGNDDGSTITALTLDMSNGGKATFNNGISSPSGHVSLGSSSWADDILYLTRSNDGKMQRFFKGTTEVGSIGTNSSQLFIASPVSNDSGLVFSSGEIHPCTTTGAVRDNGIMLGASGKRFSDVYAVNFHGDGSNLTGVGGSTTWDAVGTYAAGVLWRPNAVNPGATESGSNIRACQFDGINSSGYTLSGTWRAMGYTNQGYRGTVWVRIS